MSLVVNTTLPLAAGAGGSIIIGPVLAITGTPPVATRGQPYSWLPAITGVQGNIRASLDGGLPNGLSLNSGTGAISGTPVTEQTANFGVTIRDDFNVVSLPGLTLTVQASAGTALSITGSPGNATIGDSPTFAPTIAGGAAPYMLSLLSGALPPGRVVNSAAKTVTGAYTTAGSYSYVLRATDNAGATADLSVSITVAAAATPPEPATLSTLDADEWSWAGRSAAIVTNPTAGSTSQVLSSTDNWASMGARGSELRFEKAPGAAGTTRQVTIRTSKGGQFVDRTHTITSRKTWPKPLRARPSAMDKSMLWQDAAGTIPVVNDGDPIGRLLDPVSGWVWSQTTAAARPIYRTNGPGGKPAMRFDGAQFLDAETPAAIAWLNDGFNAKKFSINVVAQCDAIPSAAASLAVLVGWSTGTSINHTIAVNQNAAIQAQFSNGGALTTNGTLSMVAAGTPFMIAENANGARSKPCVGLVRDGLFDLKPASGNDLIEIGSVAFGPFAATRMTIGRGPGTTPYWFTGFITEFDFFDGDIGIVTANYVQKRINEPIGLTTLRDLPFVASDPSKWEAWRFDDFDAANLNAQLTPIGTDMMPTSWTPGYVAQGAGRQIFGSGGALEAEVQLFGDTRNAIVNQTPPARLDDSKLKIEPILLPSQLKQGTFALTGQITTQDTSTAVTGVGTKFTTELALATLLHDDQGRYLGYVNAINSDTSLTFLANATFSVTNVAYKKVGLAASVGTVSTTAGSNIVTAGTGADFVNRYRKGYLMFAQDGSLIGEVDTVTTTQITLKSPAPTTFSGVRVARAYSHLSYAQTSLGFLNRQYGKIEIRAKMGGSIPGDFGALWLMPTAYVWPGEIDIHEQFGLHGSSSRHTSLHTDPYRPVSAGAANKIVTATSVNTDPLDEEYHLLGVEWDETGVVCTLDNYRLSSVRLVDGIRNAAIVNAGDGSAPNGTRTLNVLGGTSEGTGASISVTSSGGVATAVSVLKSGRWYGAGYILKETDGSDVKYGQSFTVDYGPDTAIPSQFHGPFYMLINQALGSIGGALVDGDPLPKMEVDYVRWQKPKRTPPAKLTVGNTPSFDTTVENAALAIINGHASRGSNLSTAEQAAVRYFVRQFMAWELRNDVRETNMPALWDNTKRSLWDARDAIYFPAFGRTRAASKINWKDPSKELSEVGTGIGWAQGRGLSLPGTAGVYLSGGPLITDTQFNQYDNGFGAFLTQSPTNATLGTVIAFDASHRFDVASNEFDQRMCHAAPVTGYITRSQAVARGMYVATRGHRPEQHMFKDGEMAWGGYISSDAVATRAGSLKIGSRDGTTAGAAFEFGYAWAGRRALQEEAERETAVLNATLQMAGFTV